MSKLTMAQRRNLKPEQFADPDNRLYPILDQDDVDSAARLIGKARNPRKVKKQILAMCKELDLDPPAAWVEEGMMEEDTRKGLELAQMSYPKALSFNTVRTLVEQACKALYPDEMTASGYSSSVCYVSDVFQDYAIVRHYKNDKTYQVPYTINKDKVVTLGDPVEVVSVQSYEPVKTAEYSMSHVLFSAEDVVVRDGLIFEAGDYPDKQFELTPEELLAAVEAFASPVQVDYEHTPGPLDGRLGELQQVWASDDGMQLFGKVALPSWLDKALGDGPRKVSTTWDRSSKTIRGLALTTRPRVSDAALMAAFSGGKPMTMQPPSKTTLMDRFLRLFEDAEPSGVAGTQAANPQNPASTTAAQPAAGAQPVAMSQQPAAGSASASAGNDELAQLRAEVARERAKRIESEAVAFAEGEISASRAFPAERQQLVEAYVDAAAEDVSHPREVKFSTGDGEKTGTRVDALKARSAARPKHGLTTPSGIPDQKRDANGQVLMNNTQGSDGADNLSQEEEERLLGATTLGRAILDERRKMAQALLGQKSEAGRTLASK